MTLEHALDIVIARTGHHRFKWLCSEDNPDAEQREAYRAQVISMATGEPPQYPSLLAMAGNIIKAAGQAISSGFEQVDEVEQERRISICRECEFFDSKQMKCRRCGCYLQLKKRLAAWHCPLIPPKW